jgi:hypothetical protein
MADVAWSTSFVTARLHHVNQYSSISNIQQEQLIPRPGSLSDGQRLTSIVMFAEYFSRSMRAKQHAQTLAQLVHALVRSDGPHTTRSSSAGCRPHILSSLHRLPTMVQ